VLFDTGADGEMLLRNLARLDVDATEIDAIVLSHMHDDHVGGLAALLEAGIAPTVYIPASFPEEFKAEVGSRAELVEVSDEVDILPGVRTTGEVGLEIVEQALALDTSDGRVVVTGCAHPGIVKMVSRAIGASADPVALVLGGFHLERANREQLEAIAGQLEELGVYQVAPTHCSGDLAREVFSEWFGENGLKVGVGWTIVLSR
jgi:7,8-dihydropterin-6-yl-methyl-4-(beta-D-ribofuranosyl)aminobenzene 5'-phosphate synthase